MSLVLVLFDCSEALLVVGPIRLVSNDARLVSSDDVSGISKPSSSHRLLVAESKDVSGDRNWKDDATASIPSLVSGDTRVLGDSS